ncbi:MAG: fucose permease [Anaerocolumna sp.]|jgi:fucose permease|nr:fucose permease [Anaerocolumna sp.]
MLTLLLIVIYISFISLGLPDSLLGSAWPILHADLSVPISYAGIISMIVSGGTIISSFFSEKIIRKLGTGLVTAISVLMTAGALLGFSYAPSFIWLCILAIPLGLGAGSVDAGLNNFVALHYKARHMSWLHCFWGIGATLGPVIMSINLNKDGHWNLGYRTIGIIQTVLVILLFISLPLWKKIKGGVESVEETEHQSLKLGEIFRIRGAKTAFISFFCYCALEATTGLWGSSYLVFERGINSEVAAKWISLFYLGITIGRFISGFATMKFNNQTMIRIGEILIVAGIAVLFIPSNNILLQIGFLLIGLGCAPIYPCMLHETPNRFSKSLSASLMGIQMAFAYVGSTFMPPLFGAISGAVSLSLFPFFLFIILILMILSSEHVNIAVKNKRKYS